MFETVLLSLAAMAVATLIFTVALPLLGFLIGLSFRVLLPYLLIPALASSLLHSGYPEAPLALMLPLLTLLWSVLVIGTRQALVKRCTLEVPWFQGHYRAAASLLSLGSLVKLALPFADYLNRHIPEEELELSRN